MKKNEQVRYASLLAGIVCVLLVFTTFFSGCMTSAPETTAAQATVVAVITAASTTQPVETTAASAQAPVAIATTGTPAPVYTYSEGNVIAYTAASLKGVSPKLAEGFAKMHPGHTVVFNLDGTQALKIQVQNGAYADVFISASNSYTNELKKGGFFVDNSVRSLTTNYVIVILPADNPGKITSLADLSKPGLKIARAAKTVPVGTATDSALANLAKSTYGSDWNTSIYTNTITYETSEPAVATKVALGEVDAGFVYESTAIAAKPGTYLSITIPKKDNYLQTYTIGVLKGSTSRGAAADFENFILSDAGQQILGEYGFRPA